MTFYIRMLDTCQKRGFSILKISVLIYQLSFEGKKLNCLIYNLSKTGKFPNCTFIFILFYWIWHNTSNFNRRESIWWAFNQGIPCSWTKMRAMATYMNPNVNIAAKENTLLDYTQIPCFNLLYISKINVPRLFHACTVTNNLLSKFKFDSLN